LNLLFSSDIVRRKQLKAHAHKSRDTLSEVFFNKLDIHNYGQNKIPTTDEMPLFFSFCKFQATFATKIACEKKSQIIVAA
jgi:hypothetical protein